jgi:hypothetical protein
MEIEGYALQVRIPWILIDYSCARFCFMKVACDQASNPKRSIKEKLCGGSVLGYHLPEEESSVPYISNFALQRSAVSYFAVIFSAASSSPYVKSDSQSLVSPLFPRLALFILTLMHENIYERARLHCLDLLSYSLSSFSHFSLSLPIGLPGSRYLDPSLLLISILILTHRF